MAEEYLTPEEAADVLKVNVLTIRRWLNAGTLKGTKIGRLWQSRRSDLDRWMAGEAPKAPWHRPKR